MENNIPTAKEFLNQKVYITQDDIEDVHDSISNVTDAMIEFAKLHVEAALKEASENGVIEIIRNAKYGSPDEYVINKESILNSYPLTNIK